MFRTLTNHPRLLVLAVTVLVLSATFIAYWPGLHGPFLFDDNTNIVANQALRLNNLGTHALLRAAFSSGSGLLYRPLSMLSFALNYYALGGTAFHFKLINLMIHLINVLLLACLSHKLITACKHRYSLGWSGSQIIWTSLVISAAWALHPLNLTAVLYAVQRMTSLAALFTLAGMLAYVAGRNRMRAGKIGWPQIWVLTPIFCVLGILCKEDAALLPVYLLIIEWLLFGFQGTNQKIAKSILTFYLCILVLPGIAGLGYLVTHKFWVGYALRDFSLGERLLTELRVVWLYIQWTVYPNIRQLALYHDDLRISKGFLNPITTLWSALALATLLALAIWQRKRRPLFSLGILFFFAGQLMESTIIPLELAFEHRNYLPDFGLLLAVFSLLLLPDSHQYLRVRFSIRWSAALLTLPILFSATLMRATEWDNYQDFTSYEALHHPGSPRAVYSLGQMYASMALSGAPGAWPIALKTLAEAGQLMSNIMPYAAMMITNEKLHYPVDPRWREQAIERLHNNPLTTEDTNALNSLTNCLPKDCKYLAPTDYALLQAAFHSPNLNKLVRPEADLWTIFANYLTFTNAPLSEIVGAMQQAVNSAPNIPTYRISLCKGLMMIGDFPAAEEQIRELGRLNKFGSLDLDIVSLKASLTASRANQEKTINNIRDQH